MERAMAARCCSPPDPVGEADLFQTVFRASYGLAEGKAVEKGGEHDIFQDCEFGQHVIGLEDESDVPSPEGDQFVCGKESGVGAVQEEDSGIGTGNGSDDVEESCFSASGSAEESDPFPCGDVETDAAQHLDRSRTDAELFPDVPCRKKRFVKFLIHNAAPSPDQVWPPGLRG